LKFLTKPKTLSLLCGGMGLVCLALRQWLLFSGVDSRGLMDYSHPGNWLSWILTLLAALILLVSLRHTSRPRFAPSGCAALGLVLAALGFLAAARSLVSQCSHPLRLPTAAFGAVSALCCFWRIWGICRKKRVPGLTLAPGVIFHLLFMVCRYPQWSSEPELQLSFFHMAALGALAVTVYLRGCAALSPKSAKAYLAVSRFALFMSLGAIPGSADALSLGLWALSVLLDGVSPARTRTAP